MSLPSDLPLGTRSPKPKLTREESLTREAERLTALSLRAAIDVVLEEQGITEPHAIAAALGMPQRDAIKLLDRRQWRAGDLALLQALAVHLGMNVPDFQSRRLRPTLVSANHNGTNARMP